MDFSSAMITFDRLPKPKPNTGSHEHKHSTVESLKIFPLMATCVIGQYLPSATTGTMLLYLCVHGYLVDINIILLQYDHIKSFCSWLFVLN